MTDGVGYAAEGTRPGRRKRRARLRQCEPYANEKTKPLTREEAPNKTANSEKNGNKKRELIKREGEARRKIQRGKSKQLSVVRK